STGQLQIDNIDEDMLENYENDWSEKHTYSYIRQNLSSYE
ncbi:3041_t:CDS:1, partial [Paraglomus brasilianum]